jgi:hypothetical protein
MALYSENSPAIYCWVNHLQHFKVPAGTTENPFNGQTWSAQDKPSLQDPYLGLRREAKRHAAFARTTRHRISKYTSPARKL